MAKTIKIIKDKFQNNLWIGYYLVVNKTGLNLTKKIMISKEKNLNFISHKNHILPKMKKNMIKLFQNQFINKFKLRLMINQLKSLVLDFLRLKRNKFHLFFTNFLSQTTSNTDTPLSFWTTTIKIKSKKICKQRLLNIYKKNVTQQSKQSYQPTPSKQTT